MFYKIVDTGLLRTCDSDFLRFLRMSVSSVTVTAKITNLEDLRHSKSASDLQQCLCILWKKKIGILRIGTRYFYYVIVK